MIADLALVLAIDGSASVSFDDYMLIARGTAAALRDPDIAAALTSGPHRAALLAVMGFSGARAQETLVDWHRISSRADAENCAQAIEDMPRGPAHAGLTGLGGALLGALHLFTRMPGQTRRMVVDIAGNGRNNDGPSPAPIRDRMAAEGLTTNGLCVLRDEGGLLAYFQAQVIGGPGAFAVSCADYQDFPAAIRRKLLREAGDTGAAIA